MAYQRVRGDDRPVVKRTNTCARALACPGRPSRLAKPAVGGQFWTHDPFHPEVHPCGPSDHFSYQLRPCIRESGCAFGPGCFVSGCYGSWGAASLLTARSSTLSVIANPASPHHADYLEYQQGRLTEAQLHGPPAPYCHDRRQSEPGFLCVLPPQLRMAFQDEPWSRLVSRHRPVRQQRIQPL